MHGRGVCPFVERVLPRVCWVRVWAMAVVRRGADCPGMSYSTFSGYSF